ncbi:hypothetical protein KL942_004777 [Ogataea angusta]|uniref:Uncharacterized protein n=1 Tax=Pichia angusta TaxID=870730 RepID=A0ABQ7RRV0_PICAN|nr:hypothetical protein KL942_004777 [Ogataea angusta]KAG7846297.1 hypothetical protein KL940_004581 [Ogataea angusta]
MFGVLVPKTRISADGLDSVEQLRQCDTLDVAYFDENIQVVVYTPSSVAQVEVDLVYNLQNTARKVLDSKVVIGSEAVWILETTVVPDKLSNQLQIKASFRQQSKKVENLDSQDTITIGSTVLTKHVDLYELVTADTSLRISPVLQMRLKTVKTEKTMASLEVALSGQIRASGVSVRIDSVDMDIKNYKSQARRGVQMEATIHQQVERLVIAYSVHSIIDQQTVRKVCAADSDPERQQGRPRPALRPQPAGAGFPTRVQQGGADFSYQQPEIHAGSRKPVRDRARAHRDRKGSGQSPRCESAGD